MRKVGYQPLSDKIVTGIVNKDGRTWRANSKVDVTDSCIAAVFEFLKSECKKGGTDYFEIKYENTKGRIVFDMSEKDIFKNKD